MENKRNKLHYGFITAMGCGFISIICAMAVNSVGIFYMPVTSEFGVSMTAMSLTFTVFNLTYFITMPLVNKIIHKYNMKLVLSCAVFIYAAGFAVRALSNNMLGFYISSFLQADCYIIMVNLAGPMVANNWFRKHTVTIIALIALGTNIGGFIFSAAGAWIITVYGWRICYWVWTVVALVFGLPFALFVIKKTPEEMGLLPYGYDPKEEGAMTSLKKIGLSAKKAIKTPAFWLISLAIGMDCIGDTYSQFISAYAQSIGMTAIAAGLLSSFVQVGGIGGKLVLGPISDKSAKVGCLLTNASGCIAFVGLVLIGKVGLSFALFAAMCVIYGVAYSASTIGFTAITRSTFGNRDFSRIWTTMNMFMGLLGAFGSTLFGIITDLVGFSAGPYVVSIIYFIAVVCILLASANGKKYESEWEEEA